MTGKDGVYNRWIKRGLDVALSAAALLVLSPIMLLTAITIKIETPGPVIFKQTRIGLHGQEFVMYKFRSMLQNTELAGTGVYSGKGDYRVTKVGKIIRATSIDELPQLVNVLKAQMSLIGPRAPLTFHPWPYSEYTQEQLHMFDVRPGITGWAQIHGRRTVEWNERIRLNNWYVDHVSFFLDCYIAFVTVFKVLMSSDNENTDKTVKEEKI